MVQQSTADRFGKFPARHLAIMYRDYKNDFISIEAWGSFYEIPEQDIPGMLIVCKACHEAGF